MSSIVTRNILFSVQLLEYYSGANSPLGQAVISTPRSFNSKFIDIMVSRPSIKSIQSLLIHNTEYSVSLSEYVSYLSTSFPKIVLILPAETILDQLGIILSDSPKKEIQIESIMVNGTCIMYIVYIGDSSWVRIRPDEKLEYITRQLQVTGQQEASVRQLLELLLQNTELYEILRILVLTISE